MHFYEYVLHASTQLRDTELRAGQLFYNVLWDFRPGLATQIQGTELDPYYDDTRLSAFLLYVGEHWEDS